MLLTSVLLVFVALTLVFVAVAGRSLRRRPDEGGPGRRAVWLSGLAALFTMLLAWNVSAAVFWAFMLVLLANLGHDLWYGTRGHCRSGSTFVVGGAGQRLRHRAVHRTGRCGSPDGSGATGALPYSPACPGCRGARRPEAGGLCAKPCCGALTASSQGSGPCTRQVAGAMPDGEDHDCVVPPRTAAAARATARRTDSVTAHPRSPVPGPVVGA